MAAAMVAVLEGGIPGALFGIFAGLCCDALIPPFEVVHTVYFFLSGLVIGRIVNTLFKKNFATAVLCAIASLTVLDSLLFFIFYLLPRRAGFDNMVRTVLPEILFSALLTPLVYWPLRTVNKWWEETAGEE